MLAQLKTHLALHGGDRTMVYLLYVSLFHFNQCFLFKQAYKSIKREHWPETDSGTCFFFSAKFEKISVYLKDYQQIQFIFPVKFNFTSKESMTSLIKNHE